MPRRHLGKWRRTSTSNSGNKWRSVQHHAVDSFNPREKHLASVKWEAILAQIVVLGSTKMLGLYTGEEMSILKDSEDGIWSQLWLKFGQWPLSDANEMIQWLDLPTITRMGKGENILGRPVPPEDRGTSSVTYCDFLAPDKEQCLKSVMTNRKICCSHPYMRLKKVKYSNSIS